MTKTESKAMTQKNLTEMELDVTRARSDFPHMKLNFDKDGGLRVGIGGEFKRIDAGAINPLVTDGVVRGLSVLGSHGNKIDEAASNFALNFVDSMAPRDPAETLLLAQMAAIHQATMMLARRLNHVENIPQQDAAERALNKLSRTFAGQMETLKRYRSQGQQTVRVEHVTVNAGGQAIVGNVTRGEGP